MPSIDHADRGHSKLGASGAHRWLLCPGSVRHLEENPKPAGSAASDGTYTHEVAEAYLNLIFGRAKQEEFDKFTVEPDRMDRVRAYSDTCTRIVADLVERYPEETPMLAIEARFHMEDLHPLFYGTNDFATWVDWEELHVVDLKDGFAKVDAANNPQLLFYAAGVIRQFDLQVDRIFLHIYQPKLDNPHSKVQVSMKDISDFEKELLEGARRVEEEPDKKIPGKTQCKYCNTAVCEERQKSLQKEAELAFPDEDDEFGLILPDFGKYETDRLLLLQRYKEDFEQLFKDIDSELYHRATRGEEIPTKKLIHKLGNRTWKDPKRVARLAKKWGVAKEEMFEPPKLKSPSQMEKLVSSKLVDKECYRPDKGLSLVHAKAKGTAVSLGEFITTIDGLE